ncbi:helix-turn-helix transcriptional regulator [Methylobacterium sp. C25]|uniref:ArsR/SmtB family transcription factor n=1 Tax=Methylobacterium sp. C25 TaxID=2721622 RepID=UPI001F45B7E7|nr:metalloregulator ArsR/SmtB family transcription factor [Methylobacterium sp. C25]MCE4226267.1 helix-turn-helix transcriptional regulator [Methylobacterium sp. C25]
MDIEIAAKQLEALGSATRLRVYRALVRAGHAGLPVRQLQERIGIPASTLSHHLHRLIQTGLVVQERQATTLICRAVYPAMRSLVGFLVDECCVEERCGQAGKAA